VSIFPIDVYLEDTDAFGVVYHANYVKYLERGRTQLLNDFNTSIALLNKHGNKLLISKLDMVFLSPARLGDKIYVETVISKVKMSMVIFDQKIISEDKTPLSKATVKVVALDKDDNLCHISKLIPDIRCNNG